MGGGLPSLLATVVAGLRLSGECRWPPDFPRSSLATPETFAFQKALTRLIFTDFSDFLFGFDLRRNYFIKRVELFEESSILLLSRCLEAC